MWLLGPKSHSRIFSSTTQLASRFRHSLHVQSTRAREHELRVSKLTQLLTAHAHFPRRVPAEDSAMCIDGY